jgi:glycosyltransferase involved in cell wall biosynthesis
MIQANDIGIVVEMEENVVTAANYIKYLKDNPDIAAKIGDRAKYLFEKNYTFDKAVLKFKELLLACS